LRVQSTMPDEPGDRDHHIGHRQDSPTESLRGITLRLAGA
jgi:hypothetical protein